MNMDGNVIFGGRPGEYKYYAVIIKAIDVFAKEF